jgi:hypothetical protein
LARITQQIESAMILLGSKLANVTPLYTKWGKNILPSGPDTRPNCSNFARFP